MLLLFADECASVTCLNYGDHERIPAACQCACRAGFSGDYCGTGNHQTDAVEQLVKISGESYVIANRYSS